MRFDHVEFEVDDHVGIITLDRPEAANAQSQQVLEELDQAWRLAEEDREVKVIVLRSNGKHFSAGHDMSGTQRSSVDREIPIPDALYDWETRFYFHYAKRWRDVPKAVDRRGTGQVHRRRSHAVLAMRPDHRRRQRGVLRSGVVHGHRRRRIPRPHLGIRCPQGQGDPVHRQLDHGRRGRTARHGQQGRAGRRAADRETLALAHRIAQQDSYALRMAKRAVNRTLDAQGFSTAIEACFDMHQLGHSRALAITGDKIVLTGLSGMKERNQ